MLYSSFPFTATGDGALPPHHQGRGDGPRVSAYRAADRSACGVPAAGLAAVAVCARRCAPPSAMRPPRRRRPRLAAQHAGPQELRPAAACMAGKGVHVCQAIAAAAADGDAAAAARTAACATDPAGIRTGLQPLQGSWLRHAHHLQNPRCAAELCIPFAAPAAAWASSTASGGAAPPLPAGAVDRKRKKAVHAMWNGSYQEMKMKWSCVFLLLVALASGSLESERQLLNGLSSGASAAFKKRGPEGKGVWSRGGE